MIGPAGTECVEHSYSAFLQFRALAETRCPKGLIAVKYTFSSCALELLVERAKRKRRCPTTRSRVPVLIPPQQLLLGGPFSGSSDRLGPNLLEKMAFACWVGWLGVCRCPLWGA